MPRDRLAFEAVEPKHHEFRLGPSGPRLHSLRWGESSLPPLLLLHGGGANARWWDHIAPAFAQRFHVVAPDFRGHGDSERPEELVPGAFDEDLAGVLRQFHGVAPILVGHSMGANIALTYAANHPVHALVLLDPARGGTKRSRRRLRLALAVRQSYASRDEAIERFRFLPHAEHASESLRRSIAQHSVEQGADERWRYKFDSRWFGIRGGSQPELARVRCPALVIRGKESRILSDEDARAFTASLAAGECAEIDLAGHHVQLDQPDAVVDCINRFLAAHPPPEA